MLGGGALESEETKVPVRRRSALWVRTEEAVGKNPDRGRPNLWMRKVDERVRGREGVEY